MNIPARYPNNALPRLDMQHHREDTIWQIAAIVAGGWCVVLLGIVVVLVYRGSL